MTLPLVVCMTTPGAWRYRFYLAERIQPIAFAMDSTGDSVDTCRAALSLAGGSACLLLEDDVLLCDAFPARAAAEVARRGGAEVVSLYTPAGLESPGGRWCGILHATVATYLPAGCAAEAAAWSPPGPLPRHRHDLLLAGWFRAAGRRVWMADPSLVQHRPGPSRSHPRAPHLRQAANFSGPSAHLHSIPSPRLRGEG